MLREDLNPNSSQHEKKVNKVSQIGGRISIIGVAAVWTGHTSGRIVRRGILSVVSARESMIFLNVPQGNQKDHGKTTRRTIF